MSDFPTRESGDSFENKIMRLFGGMTLASAIPGAAGAALRFETLYNGVDDLMHDREPRRSAPSI